MKFSLKPYSYRDVFQYILFDIFDQFQGRWREVRIFTNIFYYHRKINNKALEFRNFVIQHRQLSILLNK